MRERDPQPGTPSSVDESADERAFDEYLERALSGAAPDPGAFAQGHGQSGALRSALERIYKRARAGGGADGELPFERLGDYRLIRRLAGGGMGLVFLAEQESLGRQVALKIIRPELRGSAVAAERFHREARAVAQLVHPNIVTVHAAGEEHGVRYLAMELIEGESLDELIKRGEMARLARRVRWVLDLARALDFAHSRGVIHRDVKPSNVRITSDGRALLLDFGLARTADSDAATLTDGFAGSPSYASPEQISRSAELDHRTDVYSLGVTLYQCVTGAVPFEGASVEQLFHRILSAEPTPPRKRIATIPRDLDTVVLKSIERDPARRYASAGELASDLEAVLELRPIRGRPPSAIERMRRAARRHPALATAATTGALALALLVFALIAQRRLRRAEQRNEAERSVQLARDKIADYRASRESLGSLLFEVENLRKIQQYQHLDAAQYALLDQNERRLEGLHRAWEATFYEVLDLLRHAERVDPDAAGTEAVRAELHFERYREASEVRDEDAMEFHKALVLEHDLGGRWARELAGELVVSVVSQPPGAEVFLFRYDEHAEVVDGGEPRQVPVPVGSTASAVAPGTWALRVIEPAGGLERGDLVVELAGQPIEGLTLVVDARAPIELADRLVSIDGEPCADGWALEHLGEPGKTADEGPPLDKTFVFENAARERRTVRGASLTDLGLRVATAVDFAADRARSSVPARVYRRGAVLALDAPPGLQCRTTAAPVLVSSACSLGKTPLAQLALPSNRYLLVLELEGHEQHRVTLMHGRGAAPVDVRLWPVGSAPAGFVWVEDFEGGFWIQEREVTAGEYLEFINAPETLAVIDAASEPALVPRAKTDTDDGQFWTRVDADHFALPDEWSGDWPVLGISWDDAWAYARWRTARARERGLDHEYALPTYMQYVRAGVGRLSWSYTWGPRFRAKWSHTCFARPTASPGRVMQFPIDQSAFGVFDLCGGVFEWLDHWYDEGRHQRGLGGGAWGHSDVGMISVAGGYGAPPEATSASIGMRLVLRIGRNEAR